MKVPFLPSVLSTSGFDIAELLKVCPRSKNVGAINHAVAVEVVMTTENYINKPICLFCELVVIWFSLMRDCDDYFGTLFAKTRHKLFGGG